jgi:hypothetical protein
MKAWLITWDWVGDHAAVTNPIVDVLSARTSIEDVRIHVARLYARERLSWSERLDLVRYAKPESLITGVTRGGGGRSHIDCGHNPFLWARVVDNLRVVESHDGGPETLAWDDITGPPPQRLA